MTMSGPIVCGVDDSTGSRDAVATALAVSARTELPLLFVHVAPDEPRLSRRDPERKRRLAESVSIGIEVLERATGRLACGRPAHRRVPLGDPAEQLVAVAASTGAEMVIVGSRGRSRVRAALRGSVSRALVALCECPVLVVPPGARVPDDHAGTGRRRPPSVLCGIDGSPEAIQAARVASRLAARLGDRLVLAHAYPSVRTGLAGRYEEGPALAQWTAAPALLASAADSLRHEHGPDPELTLEPGDPRRALIRAAGREDAEVLVLGAHTQRPSARRSAAATLVGASPIPTLIVPAAAEPAALEVERGAERERSLATT
jgi:nucleotide-binding universal stress UspA family protein